MTPLLLPRQALEKATKHGGKKLDENLKLANLNSGRVAKKAFFRGQPHSNRSQGRKKKGASGDSPECVRYRPALFHVSGSAGNSAAVLLDVPQLFNRWGTRSTEQFLQISSHQYLIVIVLLQ